MHAASVIETSAPQNARKRPAARQPPAWFVLLAFATTLVLFSGVAAEVIFRLAELRQSAQADPRCAGSDVSQLTQKGLFAVDPVAGYVMQPNLCVRLRTSEYDQVLRTNSQGMVGPEVPPAKAAGEFRIVVLGDSYTVGGQVAYEQTFPALLEQELHSRGYAQVRVINAGVGGYTTYNEAGLLRKDVSWLQPDLVVVAAFVGNDIGENILATAGGYANDPFHPKGLSFGAAASVLVQQSLAWFPRNGDAGVVPPPWNAGEPLPQPATTPAPPPADPKNGPLPAWIFSNSPLTTVKNAGHWVWDGARSDSLVLGRLFGMPPNTSISTEPGKRLPSKDQRKLNVSSFEWTILRDLPRTYWIDLAWPLLGAYLADIRTSAAAANAPVLVMVIPEIAQVDSSQQARTMADYRFGPDEVDWKQPQRLLAQQADRAGVPVLDLLPLFEETPERDALYLADDQHFTALGHRTTAEGLANTILASNWLR